MFAAKQPAETEHQRLSRVRPTSICVPAPAPAQSSQSDSGVHAAQQLWSKMVPTYDSDAMPSATTTSQAMNNSVYAEEDAL
jgi:hypothetical protein